MIEEVSAATCPVCDREFDSLGELRAHLLVRHHKSDLATVLLEGRENRPPKP